MQMLDADVLRACARSDMTCADMARFLRVSYMRVWQSVRHHGIDVRQGPAPLQRSNAQVMWKDPRRDQFEEMVKAGRTRPEIIAALNVSYPTLRKWLQQSGLTVASCKQQPERKARAEKMAHMFRQGVTLEKIGQTFGVTRERVRQILKKHGINRDSGGQSVATKAKRESRKSTLNARSLIKYGLSREEMNAARAKGLTRAYRNQRHSAHGRGIEWGLSFGEWLQVWELSGKLEQRGRGKGKYCMSRIKDTGGYVLGNVHIQLATENSLDAVKKWKGKEKANRGVFNLYPGLSTPFLAKVGQNRLGLFATEEEAIQARLAFIQSNGMAIGRDGVARKAA